MIKAIQINFLSIDPFDGLWWTLRQALWSMSRESTKGTYCLSWKVSGGGSGIGGTGRTPGGICDTGVSSTATGISGHSSGSIGVVAQIPNVHRLLKKNDVDVEVLTAGKYKRTLTLLGENTEEGRQKFREELEDVHDLFKRFVVDNRPGLDLDTVATGEAWYGTRAIELNLVDELVTSDDYLARCCDVQDVYDVRWVEDKKPIERVLDKVSGVLSRMNRLLDLGEK